MHLTRRTIAMVGLAGLVAGLAACRIPGPDGAPDSAQPAVQAGNLLPNASFELPLGEEPRQPGNWGDILNALTINLAASNQQPGNWPPRRVEAEAVEGDHAARIALDPAGDAFVGHLTSPVVPVRGGQVYTLSAYVKSEVPSAWLKLCFWTRPLDWRDPDPAASAGQYLAFSGPDAQSEAMEVSGDWKRYQFTFVVEHLVSQGVADLVVGGKGPGKAWVDAVQLEEGPRASAFRTRFPVEAVLAGRRKPPMLHLVDEPLELVLASYNSSGSPWSGGMRLNIDTLEGRGVLEKRLLGTVPAGFREQKLSYSFELVGEFRARVGSGSGTPIGLEDYLFVVHPVMHRDLQAVTYSRRGRLHQLPAERVWIPWNDNEDFFADPQANLTVTRQGAIYAGLKGGVVAVTRDGGAKLGSYPLQQDVAFGASRRRLSQCHPRVGRTEDVPLRGRGKELDTLGIYRGDRLSGRSGDSTEGRDADLADRPSPPGSSPHGLCLSVPGRRPDLVGGLSHWPGRRTRPHSARFGAPAGGRPPQSLPSPG